ncbi:MAG: MFS transporter [bacterium]|nr:MFS transporter [bacterium]
MFKKSIYGFYLVTFLQNAFKVITPFYIIYFVALGFSFWQIALISSLRSVIGLIFEIPTGMIADIYGKKISVILGYSLSALTLLLVPLTDNFLWIAVIFCFNAFFETFFTGADNAWISDRIENENPDDMNSFFMRKRSLRNIGVIIAGVL